MTPEDINFLLGVWGAALATFLAALKILEVRHQISQSLQVFAFVGPLLKGVDVEVANTGRKPITITSLRVGYGRTARGSELILETRQRLPTKLEEGDQWVITLDREELKSGVLKGRVLQAHFQLVWVTIESATKRQFHGRVKIDPSILTPGYYEPAREFIAADLLLGFPQSESEIYDHPRSLK